MKQTGFSDKNVLVVSNNVLSQTNNNGKTLASLIRSHPKSNIFQLYFSDESPSMTLCENYFKISDLDILKRSSGKKIELKDRLYFEIKPEKKSLLFLKNIKMYQTSRIIREVLWKYPGFNEKLLFEWIYDKQIDVVIFCAGDSVFAYDIVESIVNKFKTKLVVYITDDYILPRLSFSAAWWIRRAIIVNRIGKILLRADLFLTVSDKMREVYKDIFNKDSLVYFNKPENILIEGIYEDNDRIELIYAGGFHFNRWKVLHKIALAIKNYNMSNKKKAFLSIYSNTAPNKRILKKLNVKDSSEYLGHLDSDELKIKLNRSDILVHVEAFDNKSIASTRLSLSTKIPEYLLLNKYILAIGPSTIASIDYLSNKKNVIIIDNKTDINSKVYMILKDCIEKEARLENNNVINMLDINQVLSKVFKSRLRSRLDKFSN